MVARMSGRTSSSPQDKKWVKWRPARISSLVRKVRLCNSELAQAGTKRKIRRRKQEAGLTILPPKGFSGPSR